MNHTETANPHSPARAWLSKLRAIARGMLVTQRLGWVAAWTLAVLLVAGAGDYLLRTPMALRMALWVIGLLTLVGLVRRVVWPAVRFRPALTEVALRVERSEAGKRAGLEGVLASGLELEQSGGPAAALAAPVVADSQRRVGTLSALTALAPTRTIRSLVWLMAAIGAVAVVAGLEPRLTRIGASRLLWPLADAQWPKRTGVIDITGVQVHPLGSALALRAAVTTPTGARASDARVTARYRIIGGGEDGATQQVLLTAQDRDVRLSSEHVPIDAQSDRPTTGHLFERLIEPSGLRAGEQTSSGADKAPSLTLEYWFETEDDQSKPIRVLLVEPPAIVGASATVELPPYAASMLDRLPDLSRVQRAAGDKGVIDLGAGVDERAAAPPMLTGSRITVSIRFNKAIPGMAGPLDPAWVERCLGDDVAALMASTQGAGSQPPVLETRGDTWTLGWTLDRPLRISVKAIDEHGIPGVEEANYRFDSMDDNPPSAVVTAPMEDKSVLATATVELAGEARDDVALEWATLEHQLARKPQGSEGAPAEPVGERMEFARVVVEAGASADAARRLSTSSTLELSDLDLRPGEELWITLAAADTFELGGRRHEPVRSSIRKLRIMSREELVQEIWGELGGVRRTAVKIDQDQRETSKGTARTGRDDTRRTERAQTGISERLARQAEAIAQAQERVQENGLTDQTLNDVLRDASERLNRAGENSSQASESLSKADQAESQENAPPEAGQAERQEAAESQEEVRRELSKLIDLLDQGEDTYAAKRALEQILDQQKSLRDRTQQAGQSTTGKSQQQLSSQEQQDLQQIAQQQQENADALKDAIDKMLERERKLEKNDPAAAQQMSQSARRGQREQAAEKMQQAAQQVQQNQTNTAQQQQNQAIQSLEQMLKELDKTASTRDEVLRRYLASLIESLRGLVAQQEARIAELEAAKPTRQFAGLDAGMARLHQATLGVIDEARAAPREAGDVLELIDRAADAQAAAVVGLRDNPVNDEEVMGQEQLSLDKLNEAIEAGEKLDEAAEERQNDRKRAELRGRYEEAYKTQISIRESALGLVGAEGTRRNRATARQLGEDQDALRKSIETIRSETRELSEAKVFDYAHTRIDGLMSSAAQTLDGGESTDDATRRQASAARVLQSLIDALDDRQNKDDKRFREREQGGGSSGSGEQEQPLVPPAAELKLLRLMQMEIAERTRDLGENNAANAQSMGEVTQLQRELADQAKALLDKVKQQGPGDGPGVRPMPQEPDQPAEPQPDEPDPAKPEAKS